MLGDQVLPFNYAGLASGCETRGLRFNEAEAVSIRHAGEYLAVMQRQGIILDPAARRQMIAGQVTRLQREVGAAEDIDPALLDEVTQLVEAPTALRGSFDQEHLQLPPEVLISVMKKHQRYFPVHTADGRLMSYFIAVRNGGDQHLDVVTDGNEQVIRARFADAAFFINEDLQHKLEDYLPRLATLTFQIKLGSMLDKSRRIERLVDRLIPMFNLGIQEDQAARRAAHLSKADLVTNMVIEMTALQGIMGRYYALQSGESEAVAGAIYEHYLPRFAGDRLPETKAGLVIGLADRLDSLAGLFAAGLAPSGNKDPFALRRAALGLVQNLIAWDLDFDLKAALMAAASHLPLQASPESQQAVLEFVVERLRNVLLEQGRRYDVVDAVLAAQGENPARASRAVKELDTWVSRPDWNSILPAYARCVRITRDLDVRYSVAPPVFAERAEIDLYEALAQAEVRPRSPGSVDDFLNAFLPMIPTINHFFDVVLVMAEDKRLRLNRLGLLQRIAALADGVADMSRLEGF
jgi:glycyl-tRNA synthetase